MTGYVVSSLPIKDNQNVVKESKFLGIWLNFLNPGKDDEILNAISHVISMIFPPN